MILDALLAYLHFTAIFLLFSFLVVEVMLARQTIDAKAVRLLARVDLWYLFAALAVLATGLLRVFLGAKGAAFYGGNPLFSAKVALFFLIGGLSVPPTMQFMRWKKSADQDTAFAATPTEQKKLRRYLMIELHLAAVLPLLAVLMSRGIGHH
jgi:putative membrane protein